MKRLQQLKLQKLNLITHLVKETSWLDKPDQIFRELEIKLLRIYLATQSPKALITLSMQHGIEICAF